MRFSQRYGYKPVREVIQREGMDQDLRVTLWNVLDLVALRPWSSFLRYYPGAEPFAFRLWHEHWKLVADQSPDHGSELYEAIKDYFFRCEWFEVYDVLEFFVQHYPDARTRERLEQNLNEMMERELSAYRFVDHRVVEITAAEEIQTIEDAISQPFAGASTHLRAALEMLSDRESPDYRNSIKESISAVEAVVNEIEGKRATLGAALKTLGVDAHPALRGAFIKLYGYTSDADGIRHALSEESDLGFEDAKFMLVSCSAFVNYLVAKAARTGVAVQAH